MSEESSNQAASEFALMRKAIEENTKATAAMSAAMRTFFLVVLGIAVLALLAWLLMQGKVSEGSFIGITAAILSPFYGEGIGRIIERIPVLGGARAKAANVGTAVTVIAAALSMLGAIAAA
jgi:ABC-type protease/lipase transport system fused ATPase/permease subunit